MVSYIQINLLVNDIVSLPYPRNGSSQGQERFLTLSVDNKTRNDALWPNRLRKYFVCNRFAIQTFLLSLEFGIRKSGARQHQSLKFETRI